MTNLSRTSIVAVATLFSTIGCGGSSASEFSTTQPGDGDGTEHESDSDDFDSGSSAPNEGEGSETDDSGEPVSPPSTPCRGGCANEADIERPTPLPRPQCPEETPTEGASCAVDELRCSYGLGTSHAVCHVLYECTSGVWHVPPQWVVIPECLAHAPGYCPAEPPEHRSECVVGDGGHYMPCEYPESGHLRCYCGAHAHFAMPGAPAIWDCFGPPSDPRCPADLPQIGEGCTENAVECSYAPDGCYSRLNTVFCYQGAWEEGSRGGCPG